MLRTTKHLNQSDGVVVYYKSDLRVTYEEPDFNQSAFGLIIKMKSEIAIQTAPHLMTISTILF